MDEFKELIETYKDMKENELLIEMPNMPKADAGLSVNLWIDDGYRTNGEHGGRIKFQNNYEYRMNPEELISVEFSDCDVPRKQKSSIKIKKSDVNEVKNFVYNNYYLLCVLIHKLVFYRQLPLC